MALRRTFRTTLVLLPLVVAMACVPQTNGPKPGGNAAASVSPAPAASAGGAVGDVAAPQPRTATYNCADGGRMTVENLGTSVQIVASDGTRENMQASPPNQNSRYEYAHDAIVIDGREALVMKSGSTPVTCKR